MRLDISLLEKSLRAKIIKKHMQANGYKEAVCFSCGNASKALKKEGVKIIEISPSGDFIANRWFKKAEINQIFTGAFDATSGHLPIELMDEIATEIKEKIQLTKNQKYEIPTGSGETFVVLSLAFPEIEFVPIYNEDASTEYHEEAPLNNLVKALQKTGKN